ncbi:cadherin-like beta sandwich domain-containing protein [Paenibacillus sp. GCM10027626]|uniref:cadherin-like beta sandwich domain-containing protein n=1 Tax=Paenibacillus sp. GCM10027626 TaxID=3273411 RepID=UPI00363861AE
MSGNRFSASDNGERKVYNVDKAGNKRVSSNVKLADWQVIDSSGASLIDFDAAISDYVVSVDNHIKKLKMLLSAEDAQALLYVNGKQVIHNRMTANLAIAEGSNIFEITIKSHDLAKFKTYTLGIKRAASK